jgi:hypothetical protein
MIITELMADVKEWQGILDSDKVICVHYFIDVICESFYLKAKSYFVALRKLGNWKFVHAFCCPKSGQETFMRPNLSNYFAIIRDRIESRDWKGS